MESREPQKSPVFLPMRFVDIAGVGSSILPTPTIRFRFRASFAAWSDPRQHLIAVQSQADRSEDAGFEARGARVCKYRSQISLVDICRASGSLVDPDHERLRLGKPLPWQIGELHTPGW